MGGVFLLALPQHFLMITVAHLPIADGLPMLRTPDCFEPLIQPQTHARALLFIFRAGELLVRAADLSLPESTDGLPGNLLLQDMHALGLWHGRYCCAAELAADVDMGSDFVSRNLRDLFRIFDEELLGIAGRAAQIVEWARTHRYCGVCATPMQPLAGERAMHCPACGHLAYPRISPVMMVLIKKGEHILLAQHARSVKGRFSPLAGFLEAGESIEDAIHREVMEEVGLKVGNIQYFSSQSWPFPHSLMLAFTADYISGEIRVDGEEIIEARWFGPDDEFPDTYSSTSISGDLLQAHAPWRRTGR